jgi:hypothetical protein
VSDELERYKSAMAWMAGDDCGASSESILMTALGQVPRHGVSRPYDPADLGRCIRMMKLLPWVREIAFPKLSAYRQWKPFIEHWDEIAAMMKNEVGINWEKGKMANKTYERMKEIEKEIR